MRRREAAIGVAAPVATVAILLLGSFPVLAQGGAAGVAGFFRVYDGQPLLLALALVVSSAFAAAGYLVTRRVVKRAPAAPAVATGAVLEDARAWP